MCNPSVHECCPFSVMGVLLAPRCTCSMITNKLERVHHQGLCGLLGMKCTMHHLIALAGIWKISTCYALAITS